MTSTQTSSALLGTVQTNYVYSNNDHGRINQNCILQAWPLSLGRSYCARVWLYCSYRENALFFSKSTLFLGEDMQTPLTVMMNKSGFTKLINFTTPIPVGSDGRGHICISHIVKCIISFKILSTFRNRFKKTK